MERLRENLSAMSGYWDSFNVFKIVISVKDGRIYWAFQGLESEKFQLTHYENDTFTWLQPRNKLSRRGRWVGVDQSHLYYKLKFCIDSSGNADRLVWVHDTSAPPVEENNGRYGRE